MTEGTGCDVSVNVQALGGAQKTCAELIQMRNQVVSGKSTTLAGGGGGWHCPKHGKNIHPDGYLGCRSPKHSR